jgi:hypothetical protein
MGTPQEERKEPQRGQEWYDASSTNHIKGATTAYNI